MSHKGFVSTEEREALAHKKPVLKLQPYDQFPHIVVTSDRGEPINLQANNRPKLIVFYRGSFCSYCEGSYAFTSNQHSLCVTRCYYPRDFAESLTQINQQMDTFSREGVDVVAVSADSVSDGRELSDRLGLRFPIACGLTVDHMEMLGLFVHTRDPTTSPSFAYCSTSRKRLIEAADGGSASPVKTWRRPFCEPAHFFLRPDNTVKYQAAPDALYHL